MNIREELEKQIEAELERRDHERTMQTLKYAVAYALVYALAVAMIFALMGCTSSPTAPAGMTERQMKVYAYTQCFARAMGLGELQVEFHEDLQGAAGRAWPGGRTVQYHVESVENGPDWYLQAIAAHEVCHSSGIWDEKATEACALLWIAKGVCP